VTPHAIQFGPEACRGYHGPRRQMLTLAVLTLAATQDNTRGKAESRWFADVGGTKTHDRRICSHRSPSEPAGARGRENWGHGIDDAFHVSLHHGNTHAQACGHLRVCPSSGAVPECGTLFDSQRVAPRASTFDDKSHALTPARWALAPASRAASPGHRLECDQSNRLSSLCQVIAL